MPKYKVKSPLNHNNEEFKIGSTVEMTEEQAKPLLGGALALPGEDLTAKEVAQGVQAVEAEAAALSELRVQITSEQLALEKSRAQLAQDQADLAVAQDKLLTDSAEVDKQSKGGAKKA
jgi:hypothetical protein